MHIEAINMDIESTPADPVSFARNYQLEALEKALKQNTIVFLETGSGKTLIAIMLLRSYAYLIRKPSPYLAVFLVPQVVLVTQQAEALRMHTDLKVGMYWGDMGVDYWDKAKWKEEQAKHEVLVMTPAILLDGLRHCFFTLDMIKVFIFDECHRAAGRSPYACIMTEFYHRQLNINGSHVPRILGLTASPVNSKGSNSSLEYWKKIENLENLLNSKVYTCANESVLSEFIPFSTPKLKQYKHEDIPYAIFHAVAADLMSLKDKHENAVENVEHKESAKKKISKLFSVFLFCLNELGVWLALKAADFLSSTQTDIFTWGNLDFLGETVVKNFSKDAVKIFSRYIPTGSNWSISDNITANMAKGFLTSKVVCLIESIVEYRDIKDLRCIIFVERVITSIVLQNVLNDVLAKVCGWKVEYVAGNNSGLQSQSRKQQNELVTEFRNGTVNVIVATSILEEGLDVQSCNLVIRFDLSANVCSFIQSRGRARMQNSDFVLMVKSGDSANLSRVKNYIDSGNIMRTQSLSHAFDPCGPLETSLKDEEFYQVDSTGAIVTLTSSISLIYFYCSRLPSDGYFKPSPTFSIEKDSGIFTVYLPKSCSLQSVSVHGDAKILKKIACLEACKKLHEIGELDDNLVPKIVVEEADSNVSDNIPYDNEHPCYFPPELINNCLHSANTEYHCYLVELKPNSENEIEGHDFFLAVRNKFEMDVSSMDFNLEVGRGSLAVQLKYVGVLEFKAEKVVLCRIFQSALFRLLINHEFIQVQEVLDGLRKGNANIVDYLLLPSTSLSNQELIIDWNTISSVIFSCTRGLSGHRICLPSKGPRRGLHTKEGLVCSCMLQNAVVLTPHNGHLYCVTGFVDELNGRSPLSLADGRVITYKELFKTRHGITLLFEGQPLLRGRRIFNAQNHLQSRRGLTEGEGEGKKNKDISSPPAFIQLFEYAKELDYSFFIPAFKNQLFERSRRGTVELPPELCSIIMSPISIRTLFSFSLVPSIMHRIESLIIAHNLKSLLLDHSVQHVGIPTIKVLEAITTKKCQEEFHLESLETLGDSFLKYTASQQLFEKYQNHHEGLLTIKKNKIISNASLCKLGCDRKIPGFIRNIMFDPKLWMVPGNLPGSYKLEETRLFGIRKIYVSGKRSVKSKTIADVVEALIGAYLSTGGETAALLFMDWLGINIEFIHIPYNRQFYVNPERIINIPLLEKVLNYSFRDPSLLVEALTHGSYMLAEIPRSYQRLEFLGDAVLDFVMTMHLYQKFPGMSPGLLTELRSASVNNDCYAQSTVRAGLYKHILHASHKLHKHVVDTVQRFNEISLESTFGWESEASFPKVLGDIIESLAGAILVDSGYDKEVVFNSIRPLLEPLITPDTVKFHPAKELTELCQKKRYEMKKIKSSINGRASYTIEVEAEGISHKYTCSDTDKRTAKKVACKHVLKSLKEANQDMRS